jgi:hypothetical protein
MPPPPPRASPVAAPSAVATSVHDRDPVLARQLGRALDASRPPRAKIDADDDRLRPLQAIAFLVTRRP